MNLKVLKHENERNMSKRKTEIKMVTTDRKYFTQKGEYGTKLRSSTRGKEDRMCC